MVSRHVAARIGAAADRSYGLLLTTAQTRPDSAEPSSVHAAVFSRRCDFRLGHVSFDSTETTPGIRPV